MKLKKEIIMFKKTLLCAALVAVSGGAMAKATGVSTAHIHGTEGAMGIASIATGSVAMTLGASYTQGDTITLTWSQPLAAGTGHTALSISDTALSIPLTVLSSTGSSVTYRAGAVPAGYNYSAAQTIAIPAKPIAGSSQASGTIVSLSYAAATSTGQEIDAGTVGTVVAEFWDQYTVSATVKANAQIDVENSRKQFSAVASHAIDEDIITVAAATNPLYTAALVNETTGLVANLAAGLANTITVKGDFSWMDTAAAGFAIDTAVGGLAAGAGGADLVAGGGVVVAADAVTQVSTNAAPTATLAIQTEKTTVLTGKVYTADVVLKWENAGATTPAKSKTFADLAAGSWTLNGANITAYGIPNQAAVTPFLWVQNAGTTSGEISGTASCQGVTTELGSLGTAAGDSNTRVGPAVAAVMDGVATCTAGSRYDVTLTVNAKSTDITINAGYRVTAADGSNDRLALETSDSLVD
jgi:hypothetical protein